MKCDKPFNQKLKTPILNNDGTFIYTVSLRCGKCKPCIDYRINSWIFRLEQEVKNATSAFFVTLTYDTEFIPITDKGFMSLRKKELSQFFKDLKYKHDRLKWDWPIYYAVGEYGSKRRRSHYHAIILNTTELLIRECWTKGEIHIGTAELPSIKYVLKYIEKKQSHTFKDFDGEPEFSIFSRNIGARYITEKNKAYYSKNLHINYLSHDGYKIPMPKYYRDRFLSDSDKRKQIPIIVNSVNAIEQRSMYMAFKNHRNYDEIQLSGKLFRELLLKKLPDRLDI